MYKDIMCTDERTSVCGVVIIKLSPVTAVRALWRYIVSHAAGCQKVTLMTSNLSCHQKPPIVRIDIQLVLHDISIYRIDIEYEPKTYYRQCLNQHQITSKIDIE